MIIKVLPIRSYNAIQNVVNYIAIDKGRITDHRTQGIFHNLYSTELRDISMQLQSNFADHARTRKNRTKARHVILSINPLDREKVNMEIMDDLVKEYIDKAFPNAISFGTHHVDQEHFHTHLIVSGNELMSKTSTRQTKTQLREVHMHMLRYMSERYPELSIGIDTENYGKKLHSEKAYYKEKRNPDLQLTRDELSESVKEIFRLSESSKDFRQRLESNGLRTYDHKGQLQGVLWENEGKKMRFSRLGIEKQLMEELDKQNERLNELEQLREDNDNERELDDREI
ncbi:MAG: relaxase/mobilization nuclease domain-containing protein [Flavobacteriales bacterium]|nr:relaxase/mobilization nuclease domain-containing protein [Flavobacteriales bacterium]